MASIVCEEVYLFIITAGSGTWFKAVPTYFLFVLFDGLFAEVFSIVSYI